MKLKSILATMLVTLALAFTAFAQTTTYTSKSEGFTITSPVELTQKTENEKTTSGADYVLHSGSGENSNGAYLIMVGEYPFQTTSDSLNEAIGSISTMEGATLVSRDNVTVSGYPAARIVVDQKGMRIIDLLVVRGNRMYQVMFVYDIPTKPNTDEVNAFFTSFALTTDVQ